MTDSAKHSPWHREGEHAATRQATQHDHGPGDTAHASCTGVQAHRQDNVFDQVATEYEAIHNRNLPPGVKSDDFVRQKAEIVSSWIRQETGDTTCCYLDFGCGNGRLFRQLLDAPELAAMLAQQRLLLHGFDTSSASLMEAERLAGPDGVRLTSNLSDLPGQFFDFIISCNVFHHIPLGERLPTIRHLTSCLRPGGRLVLWEHNPFNPATRLLVRLCPFDGDARLLTLTSARRLGEKAGLRHTGHAYVNVLPPGLRRIRPIALLEDALRRFPCGSQYWVMFRRA